MASAEIDGVRQLCAEGWSRAVATLEKELPAGVGLQSLLCALEGECLLGLAEVHPWMMQAGDESVFVTIAFYSEVGAGYEAVKSVLREAFKNDGGLSENPDGSLTGRHDDRRGSCNVHLSKDALHAWVGPKGLDLLKFEPWLKMPAQDSMLAVDVVASAPPVPDGGDPIFEVFLNLAPMWEMIRPMMPPPAASLVAQSSLERLGGIRLLTWFEREAVREIFELYSPGTRDVLTALLSTATIDPAWQRWLDPEAESSSLLAFDLSKAFQTIRSALPGEIRGQLDQQVRGIEMMTGINLKELVIDNFGPNFAVCGSVDWANLNSREDVDLLVAAQVKDEKKADVLINTLLKMNGFLAARQLCRVGESSFFTLDVPGPDGDSRKIAYTLQQGCVLFATSVSRMEKTLSATGSAGLPKEATDCLEATERPLLGISFTSIESQIRSINTVLESVSAIPALSGVSLPALDQWTKMCSVLPDSISWSYAAESGLRVESRSAMGAASTGLLVGLGSIAAAVMIPTLLSQKANECEGDVIETLRTIHSAQATFKESGAVDTDHDGEGEYGYFAEMSGGGALRGSGKALELPVLPAEFKAVRLGCVLYKGYLYTIDLPGPQGYPYRESANGGCQRMIPADEAERGWVAYAWPETIGSAGVKVFVIDESGEIFSAENQPPEQGYAGLHRIPEGDAAFLRAGNNRDKGIRSVRRGRDGALWLEEGR